MNKLPKINAGRGLQRQFFVVIWPSMRGKPSSDTCDRKGHSRLPGDMGERSAARPKSGQSVSQSDPGLRRPTPPSTAGRKPAARPPQRNLSFTPLKPPLPPREAGPSQPKTGRVAGRSPAIQSRRAAPESEALSSASPLADLQDFELGPLLEFFKILDRWDREAHGKPSI